LTVCEAPDARAHARYEGLCNRLARADRWVGQRRSAKGDVRGRPSDRDRLRRIRTDLELAGIALEPRTVISAGRGALVVCAVMAAFAAAGSFIVCGAEYVTVQAFVALVVPVVAREAVLSYPASAANKRAERVMKGAPEAANLMIMSLRHEPSLSRAIRFASERGSEFSHELKQCIWDVVMGRHSSFEDSLQGLGAKWERHDPDLKASLHAMVTSSCEATEDGKRRALDRANTAIISGAKRRIEAYALSLSTPSMVIFGLGILLPLMVGSFLPMMSWSIWSPGDLAAGEDIGGGGDLLVPVFLMNILFPCIALFIALGAVSRHPFDSSSKKVRQGPVARALVTTAAVTVLSSACAYALLGGAPRMSALLLSLTLPWAVMLLVLGRGAREARATRAPQKGLEDALFRTGARMMEGENFEAAIRKAAADTDGEAGAVLKGLSFRSGVAGQGFDESCREEARAHSDANALEGLRVVHEAASKDELAAGMLAMDLAAYLKDLHDLEAALKNRLRPTISMMRVTAFALGPIVMGVTFAIYLTLMSMAPGTVAGLDAELFFVVLGVFLAETNGVVSYFVWGIEGGNDASRLMWSLGTCMMVSELVYIATATAAS